MGLFNHTTLDSMLRNAEHYAAPGIDEDYIDPPAWDHPIWKQVHEIRPSCSPWSNGCFDIGFSADVTPSLTAKWRVELEKRSDGLGDMLKRIYGLLPSEKMRNELLAWACEGRDEARKEADRAKAWLHDCERFVQQMKVIL